MVAEPTHPYYLRARYYDPATGQFISRDPAVGMTREPYAYTYDNPLNLTDPSGLFGWEDVKNAAHHVLNFIAPIPYAQYYVAYQDLKVYGPYLPPPLVGYLELQQASGLAGDVAIDWLKQRVGVEDYQLNDEGRVDHILPREICGGGPKTYLPGWHQDDPSKVDFWPFSVDRHPMKFE